MLFLESHLLKYAWYRYYLLFRPSLADTIHPLELHSRNQPTCLSFTVTYPPIRLTLDTVCLTYLDLQHWIRWKGFTWIELLDGRSITLDEFFVLGYHTRTISLYSPYLAALSCLYFTVTNRAPSSFSLPTILPHPTY